MGRRFGYLAFLLIILLCGGSLLAQSDRATITGTVKDTTGAVLPGVTVTVTNVDTNIQNSVQTNSLGLYTVAALPIGRYSVAFTKDAFKTLERKGITLLVGQVAAIDVALEVGATTDTVTVTAEAPILRTETSSISTNITSDAYNEIPLNVQGSRTLASFMFAYVPGVEGSDYDSHINGSMSKTKEVLIDGISAIASMGGFTGESGPPMESIQEFQASTGGLRADEGHSGGGAFRYQMKSGTNSWHGSGLFFMHNEAFNANSWGNKYTMPICLHDAGTNQVKINDCKNTKTRATDRLYDYGGSFGGPIVKDKTFFFFALEQYRFANYGSGNTNSTVPTTDFLNGNFSALLDTGTQIGTDAGGNPVYKGAIINPATGLAFPGNIIPASSISPISKKIVDIYKAQYQPIGLGFTNNNAMPASSAPWYHVTNLSIKLDHVLNNKHRLAGSFVYSQSPRMLADQGGIWAPGTTDGGPFANAYTHNVNAPSVRISDTWAINPTTVNVFSAALNRFHSPSMAVSQKGNWASTLGLGDWGAGNFPIIKFQGPNGTDHMQYNGNYIDESQLGSQFNDYYTANTYIFNDNLSWMKGRHTFKFGAEFRAAQFNSFDDTGVPKITFSPAQTAGTFGFGNAGFGFASFLLGQVNQMEISNASYTYGRRKTFSAYASDDFKVSSRLTMNFDLRWDFNGKYHEKYGHWSNFNPNIMNTALNLPGALEFAKDGSDSFERRQHYHNFSGSVGAAFQLTPKTVVRASGSVFYVPLNMNTWRALPYGFNPGFNSVNRYLQPFNWNAGYPGQAVAPTQDPNYTQWGMVAIDPNMLELGNIQGWTVGVERELTKDTRLEVNFVQNHGYHLEGGALGGNQPKLSDYTAAYGNIWGNVTKGNWSGQGWMATTPFPQIGSTWGPLFSVGSPKGNSDYKSMQVSVTKRMSHGLTIQGSYNLSASHGNIDNAFEETWGTGGLQDIYNLKQEAKSLLGYDQTHIVKGFVNYDLPFGKGKFLFGNAGSGLNALVGGWQLSTAFHYNTGTPVRAMANAWYPGINNIYANVDPNCDFQVNTNPGVGGQYFNPACITNPAGGKFGNGGNLSQVRNPNFATEDMGLNKSLSFGPEGRFKLSVRFQMFNAFNRHGLGGPNMGIGSTVRNPWTGQYEPSFGKVTWQNVYGGPGPRTGQLGARFTF